MSPGSALAGHLWEENGLNIVSPKEVVEVLTPSTWERHPIWK